MKLSVRSIPVRVLERSDPTTFGIIAVVLMMFSDESGADLLVVGLVSLLVVVLVYAILSAILQTIRWWNFDASVENDSLVVRSGIVRPVRRTIPFSRIQRVSVSRTPLSNLFGVAAFECETAGNPDETDVSIRYLDPADAAALRDRVATGAEPSSSDVDPEVVFTLRPRALVLFGTLQTHVRTVALAVGAGIVVLFLAPGPASGLRATTIALFEELVPLSGSFVLPFVAVGGWLVGVALTIERMSGFQLVEDADGFRRCHGRIRRYDADLSADRIQVARVRSNPLHRLLELAQADVGSAGLSGSLPFGLHWPLAPLAERDTAWDLVERATGVERAPLRSLPVRARRRYVVRYGLAVAGLAVVTLVARQFVPAAESVPLAIFGVALVFAPIAAHVSWSGRGYHLSDDHLVVRYGFWSQRTYVVPYARIQDVTISRSPFQRRADLVSVRVDIASLPFLPGIRLSNVDESVGADIRRRLREPKSSTECSSERLT